MFANSQIYIGQDYKQDSSHKAQNCISEIKTSNNHVKKITACPLARDSIVQADSEIAEATNKQRSSYQSLYGKNSQLSCP